MAGHFKKNSGEVLSQCHFACFKGLDRYPNTFHGAVGQADFAALQVRAKYPLVHLKDVGTDTPALFGLTLTVNHPACDGPLSGNKTNLGHG